MLMMKPASQPRLQLPWVSLPSFCDHHSCLALPPCWEGRREHVPLAPPTVGLHILGARSQGCCCSCTAHTCAGSGSSPICSQKPSSPELSS